MVSRTIFLLIPLIFNVSSCKKKEADSEIASKYTAPQWPEKHENPADFDVHTQKPFFLTLEDPTCTEENAVKDLGKRTVYLATIKGPQLVEVDLTGIPGTLKTPWLNEVLIDYHSKAVHKGCFYLNTQKNRVRCLRGEKNVENPGKKLFLCKSSYDKNSLESAVIGILSGLKDSLQYVLRNNFEQVPISIHMLAKLEHIYDFDGLQKDISSVETNNAYMKTTYTDSNHSEHLMIFLPHDESWTKLQKKYPFFWQQKGIIAHEYGHHVHSLYYIHLHSEFLKRDLKNDIEYKKSLENYQDFDSSDDETDPFYQSKISFNSSERLDQEINASLVISAFDEGAADGVSYVTYQCGKALTGGFYFPGLSNQRDLMESKNEDQSLKRIGFQELEAFLSKDVVTSNKGYNLQDTHYMGAIVQHLLVRLHHIAPIYKGEQAMWCRGLESSLAEWTKSIQKFSQMSYERLQDLFDDMLLEYVHQLEKKAHFNKEQCLKIKEVVPFFYNEWMVARRFSCAPPR